MKKLLIILLCLPLLFSCGDKIKKKENSIKNSTKEESINLNKQKKDNITEQFKSDLKQLSKATNNKPPTIQPAISINRLCWLSCISKGVLAVAKCSTVGAISSNASADKRAPAPKAANKPIITEGILRVNPTRDPRVKEQAAIAPEKNDQIINVFIGLICNIQKKL